MESTVGLYTPIDLVYCIKIILKTSARGGNVLQEWPIRFTAFLCFEGPYFDQYGGSEKEIRKDGHYT